MADNISTKIRCGCCGRDKMAMRFSESSKRKYQEALRAKKRNSKAIVKQPTCVDCSPGNREELKCADCDRTMALESFSKAQRKKAEDALCIDCSQRRQDREADHEKEIQEVEIMEEEDKLARGISTMTMGTSIANTGTRPGNSRVSRSEISRAQSERYETETNPASENWIEGNDAISYDGSAYTDGLTETSRPTTGTNWDNFRGDNGRRQTSKPGSKSDRGWVKQNAVPVSLHEKAAAERERQQRLQEHDDEVVRDSDDEEDNEEDDPY